MYCSRVSGLPEGKLYLIVTDTSVHVPGDRRSIEAPGHGYPERTEYFTELQYFTDQAEWSAAIHKLTVPAFGAPKDFRAYVAEPVTVTTEVTVAIGSSDLT